MKRYRFIALLLIALLSQLITIKADVVAFSVEINRNENQIDNSGYFNLHVEPNSTTNLSVKIINSETVPITVSATIVNAGTSVNGTNATYSKDTPIDKSMKYPLTTLIESKENITIPAQSEVAVNFELKAPTDNFEGIILGGIRFSAEKSSQVPQDNSNNEFVFENEVNYVIGVQLQNDRETINGNVKLIRNGITSFNFKPAFSTTLQNDKAKHMGNVEIFGEIYDSNKNVVAKVDVKQSQILPNTSFDIAYIPVGNKIESGKYSMYLKIRHHDDIWEWKENFTISLGEIDKVNEEVQQVYPDTSPNYLPWIMGLMGLFLLIIFLLIFLLFKRRKKDEEEEV